MLRVSLPYLNFICEPTLFFSFFKKKKKKKDILLRQPYDIHVHINESIKKQHLPSNFQTETLSTQLFLFGPSSSVLDTKTRGPGFIYYWVHCIVLRLKQIGMLVDIQKNLAPSLHDKHFDWGV